MFPIALFRTFSNEPLSWMLFSELALIWSTSNYLIGTDQVPEISATGTTTRIQLKEHRTWLVTLGIKGASCALVAGLMSRWGSWLLPALIFSATIALPLVRSKIDPRYIAELEVGANLTFVGLLAVLIDHFRLKLGWVLFTIDLSSTRIAVSSLIASALIFSLRGGTYIVRSVLDKAGTLPPLKDKPINPTGVVSDSITVTDKSVDLREYSRGRLIGNLERILLVVVVAAGSYESLAFLAAAKGFIRSKNLENRDWAEYFLVGSLTSVLVSVAVGLFVRQLLKIW
jgi:hypothetical protein